MLFRWLIGLHLYVEILLETVWRVS